VIESEGSIIYFGFAELLSKCDPASKTTRPEAGQAQRLTNKELPPGPLHFHSTAFKHSY